MKKYWSLLILFTCISLSAAEKKKLYKWIDENGNVHYTDEPRKGAEEITIKEVPAIKMKPVTIPNLGQTAPGNSQSNPVVSYQNLTLLEPQNDGVVRNNAGAVTLTAQIEPDLMPEHSIRFFLDGKPVDSDPRILTVTVTEVSYGSHSASFVVLDKDGKQISSSKVNSFHLLNLVRKNR